MVNAANQMGRLIIYKDNSPNYEGIVELYPTPDLNTLPFTYVNINSVEDVPILETTATSAKIMINGHVGWIANNVNSGNYNMKIVPLNQTTNPSCYVVKNGELIHYLSFDLEAVQDSNGWQITLGKAPSYLKEGVRYLSYDGKYFYEYDTSTLSSKLNILINDYKEGVRRNSINKDNPFYLYYQNLSFRSKTVYSAEDLNRYIDYATINHPNSKLKGLGQAFKDAESKYGVNALLSLSVAIHESDFGKSDIALEKNNLFNINAYDSDVASAKTYKTPKEAVEDFTKNYISAGYASPADDYYYGSFLGNKNRGANVKYASDPYWGEKSAQYAYQIDKHLSGGNSNLKDSNSYTIGITQTDTSVITKDNILLYSVLNDLNKYAAYTNTPVVITNQQTVEIKGRKYYEINPDITANLYKENKTGTDAKTADINHFDGNYNWHQKGYIPVSDVTIISSKKDTTEILNADQLYKIAYDKTNYATKTGTQKSINNARTAVRALKGTGAQWAIGQFSGDLDKVQQKILVKIINAINKAEKTLKQADINAAKASIDPDLPTIWKNSYSSAVDKIQNKLINKFIDQYNKALSTKSPADMDAANALAEELKTSTSKALVQWVDNYMKSKK